MLVYNNYILHFFNVAAIMFVVQLILSMQYNIINSW